jgi:DNA-binding NarL/FixJ family response regulator
MEDRLYLSERATNHILMQRARGEVIRRSPVELLSDREMDIFRRIGAGQTVEEIAAQLHLSDKTVSTYRDRIRAKLQLDSAAALVRHACLWLHEQK